MATTIRLGTGLVVRRLEGRVLSAGAKQEDRLAVLLERVRHGRARRRSITRRARRSRDRGAAPPAVSSSRQKVPRAHDAHLRGVGSSSSCSCARWSRWAKLGRCSCRCRRSSRDDAALRDRHVPRRRAEVGATRGRVPSRFRGTTGGLRCCAATAQRSPGRSGARLPRLDAITADFLYLRWLGTVARIAKCDRVQIDRTGLVRVVACGAERRAGAGARGLRLTSTTTGRGTFAGEAERDEAAARAFQIVEAGDARRRGAAPERFSAGGLHAE